MLDIIRPDHSSQKKLKVDVDVIAQLIELFGGKPLSEEYLIDLSGKRATGKIDEEHGITHAILN